MRKLCLLLCLLLCLTGCGKAAETPKPIQPESPVSEDTNEPATLGSFTSRRIAVSSRLMSSVVLEIL